MVAGCRVDAIALHSYTCYSRYLRDHLNIYRAFGKPLWLTEFACMDTVARQPQSGQMEYLREAIPMLESDPDVCVAPLPDARGARRDPGCTLSPH